MEQLGLCGNQLHGSLPTTWPASMPKLQQLQLGSNLVSGGIPESWVTGSTFGALVLLDLCDNQLSGELPAGLTVMSSLEDVALCDNQFYGGLPGDWGQFTSLYSLDLCDNNLGGTIPSTWVELFHGSVTFLSLCGNEISGPVGQFLPDGPISTGLEVMIHMTIGYNLQFVACFLIPLLHDLLSGIDSPSAGHVNHCFVVTRR